MDAPILQLWDVPAAPPEWLVAFVQLTDVLSALVGIFIAYQAYRGFRRNRSRPMLYLSLGFVLSLGVPFLLAGVYVALGVGATAIALLTQVSQLGGLLAIVYGLRMPS